MILPIFLSKMKRTWNGWQGSMWSGLKQLSDVFYDSCAPMFRSNCIGLLALASEPWHSFFERTLFLYGFFSMSSRSLCLIVAVSETFPNQSIKNSKLIQYRSPCSSYHSLIFSIAFICHINVFIYCLLMPLLASLVAQTVKNTPAWWETSIPGLGKSPGGGHGSPLQYSCLEDPHGQRSLTGYSS